jgi:hypothetical protein
MNGGTKFVARLPQTMDAARAQLHQKPLRHPSWDPEAVSEGSE